MYSNKKKFQQSGHTPFMQPPLHNKFGLKGLTSLAQAVLGGVYTPHDHIDQHTCAFLVELIIPHAVRDLGPQQMTIPVENYRKFWRKANENISCYPDELSFTMKGGASDDLISEVECDLINIALSSGYSPSRWKNLLDVMILKKAGLTQLSSLCTIVLFPMDCNFAFKHIGREMMKVVEATASLAPEQYGSRKNH